MKEKTIYRKQENEEKRGKSVEEKEKDVLAKVVKPYPHCVICKEKYVK